VYFSFGLAAATAVSCEALRHRTLGGRAVRHDGDQFRHARVAHGAAEPQEQFPSLANAIAQIAPHRDEIP
jgi:hypothetical protein